jgi:hypothetical protein
MPPSATSTPSRSQGKWKYIKLNVRDAEQPVITELYDLSTDLGETNNLVATRPEVAQRMEALLEDAHRPLPIVSLFNNDVNTETAF